MAYCILKWGAGSAMHHANLGEGALDLTSWTIWLKPWFKVLITLKIIPNCTKNTVVKQLTGLSYKNQQWNWILHNLSLNQASALSFLPPLSNRSNFNWQWDVKLNSTITGIGPKTPCSRQEWSRLACSGFSAFFGSHLVFCLNGQMVTSEVH